MFRTLRDSVEVIQKNDPAATSVLNALVNYPGLHAIVCHRINHWLYKRKLNFFARLGSQCVRFLTGIEIHPGAVIGRRFFIDHGMGVVIGETAIIGDDVTLYQGVTLGGTGKDVGKQHPTIGNNVLIGSGAKVLGPFQVGDNSNIAAGAVVLSEIPPHSTAVGVPARIVKRDGRRVVENLDQVHVPDPVAQELCRLRIRIQKLEEALQIQEEIINI